MVLDESARKEQLNILSMLFNVNQDITSEFEAQKLICDTFKKLKEENNLENYSITNYVQDTSKVKWKHQRGSKNEFIKLFMNELEFARELYGITKPEVLFLYSLSSYLLWEENLLVDKEGYPLNQKRLYKELELDRKTVSTHTKNLEKKKCLIRIWDGRETYYLINPSIMFKGEKINKAIPKLFEMLGYGEVDEINEENINATNN